MEALEINPTLYHGYCDEPRRVLCTRCGYWLNLSAEDGGVGDDYDTVLTRKHLEICQGNAAQTTEALGEWFQRHASQRRPQPV